MPEPTNGGGNQTDFGDGEQLTPTAPPNATPGRPPVMPDFDWRSRAISAENNLRQTREQLAALQSQIDEHKARIAATQRRADIETLARQAKAVDINVVAALVEHTLASQPDAEVSRVIADLKRTAPFLFASASITSSSAAGAPIAPRDARAEALAQKADEARASGDKRALLSYLRARRAT